MATKKKKIKTANPKLAAGMAAIAFGGGWGTHRDRRSKRNNTRQDRKRNAINDYD